MSVSVTFRSAYRVPLASEFFMARRPVVDREQKLVAHELLFCNVSSEAEAPATAHAEDQPVSASVIADVYQHGLGRVIGELIGILHIDAAALMSDIFSLLSPEKVILELSDFPSVSPEMLDRMRNLTDAGFHFALIIGDESQLEHPLLPHVEGVRIDITGKDEGKLQYLCSLFKSKQKKLLAENVKTIEQFRTCTQCGFDFFQGYYFTQPQVIPGKTLSPSHMAITQLMTLLTSDAENEKLEHCIKSDVTLGLNLLRLVNTPAISVHRIDSLRQALMVLGRNQLQRWLQVMLYAEPSPHGQVMMPLLALATTRGRLMELLTQHFRPGNRGLADTAFTVGIMSLIDTLFNMPMDEILQQIPVIEEVSDALLLRQGYFGKLLSLVEYTEWSSTTDTPLLEAMREFRLSHNDLYLIQRAAFEWSDHVTRSLG